MSEMTEEGATNAAPATMETKRRSVRASDQLIAFAAVIVLFIFFSIVARNFFTVRSVLSLALQTSAVTLMGIGVTFAIITGGVDLSIGSVVALSGTIAVMVANDGVPIWISMLVGLLVGVVCGLLNGLMITKLTLPRLRRRKASASWGTAPFSAQGNNSLVSLTRC
jgi:ribose/xylose/arabinose/galactoside ABC-type transport system permease subunit